MEEEETARLQELRDIKRRRLHELDKIVALRGDAGTPPEIAIERASLRQELGMVETAIRAPARFAIGDELGEGARFLVYYEQLRRLSDGIAQLGEALGELKDDSLEWRRMHRQLLLMIGIVVFFIAIVVTILVTYLATTGRL